MNPPRTHGIELQLRHTAVAFTSERIGDRVTPAHLEDLAHTLRRLADAADAAALEQRARDGFLDAAEEPPR